MHSFYFPDLQAEELILDEEESKHCIKVLRLREGDIIQLIDGKGQVADARIEDAHPKKCRLQITSRTFVETKRNYKLHIALAPTKNAERLEWFVEKAVECGIDKITFIETQHGERGRVNMERCHKIAVSAMKQSHQSWLPVLQSPLPLMDWIREAKGTRLMAACVAEANTDITRFLLPSTDAFYSIAIGPEGDFNSEEIISAQQAGFKLVTLGSSILRAETAALYACMATKALHAK
ncbi:MAG: RsmE family RNA methyltransferase [Bacteroidia bacterium]|jgi:16S rRNA (uracil1498-N3)-methyltransferase